MGVLTIQVVSRATKFLIFIMKNLSELKKQIENLFADSGNSTIINANDENKTLIVQSSVSQINEIEKIINKIDVKKAQILIEAFLLEVKPTFEKKLGLE